MTVSETPDFDEILKIRGTGASDGGDVVVTMTGGYECASIEIAPDLLERRPALERALTTALRRAFDAVQPAAARAVVDAGLVAESALQGARPATPPAALADGAEGAAGAVRIHVGPDLRPTAVTLDAETEVDADDLARDVAAAYRAAIVAPLGLDEQKLQETVDARAAQLEATFARMESAMASLESDLDRLLASLDDTETGGSEPKPQ